MKPMNQLKDWIRSNRWYLYPVILGIWGLAFVITGIIWLRQDQTLHFLSGATHMLISANQLANIRSLDIQTILLVREMYPNLYHNMTALLGLGPWGLETAGALVNLLSVATISAGAYLLGKTLWNDETALLAGMLVPALPGVRDNALVENVELLTGVFVVFSLWALIRSRRFQDRGWSVGFFVLAGLGMTAKWTFGFFILVPFLMASGSRLWELLRDRNSRGSAIRVILAVLAYYPLMLILTAFLGPEPRGGLPFDGFFVFYLILTAVLCVGLWAYNKYSRHEPFIKNLVRGVIVFFIYTNHYYLFNARYLFITYFGRFWMGRAKHAVELNPGYFWRTLFVGEFSGILFFLFLLLGLGVYLFVRNQRSFPRTLTLGCILSGLVILSLQPAYNSRYFLALSGVMMPVAVYWIFLIPRRWAQVSVVLATVAMGFLTWGGWLVLPESVKSIPPGIPVIHPAPGGWDMKGMTREFYRHREDVTGDVPGVMVALYNDSDPARLPPLIFCYLVKSIMGPRGEVFLLSPREGFSGEDPTDRPRVFVYYTRHACDEGKGQEQDMDPGGINPGAVYFIRIRDRDTPGGIPGVMAHEVRRILPGEGDALQGAVIVGSFPLSRDAYADIYLALLP